MNGRELTADDVVFNFHRFTGLGSGFTEATPYAGSITSLPIESIEATDRYTVVVKLKQPSLIVISILLGGESTQMANRGQRYSAMPFSYESATWTRVIANHAACRRDLPLHAGPPTYGEPRSRLKRTPAWHHLSVAVPMPGRPAISSRWGFPCTVSGHRTSALARASASRTIAGTAWSVADSGVAQNTAWYMCTGSGSAGSRDVA